MRLGLLTTIWQRPELTRLFLSYYARLDVPGIDLVPVAVYSPEDDTRWLRDSLPWPPHPNPWTFTPAPNDPLGAKWNTGVRFLLTRDVDAVMVVGSDDLLSASYFELAAEMLSKRWDYLYPQDFYVYDAPSRRLAYCEHLYAGAGRVLSRRVLDRLGWQPWAPALNRYLDGSLHENALGAASRAYVVRDMRGRGLAGVDVKTEGNMWRLEGRALVGAGDRLTIRRVQEEDPAAFFGRFFPAEAKALLAWPTHAAVEAA
jgi:hypothetical protein